MVRRRAPWLPVHGGEETLRVVRNSGVIGIGKVDWIIFNTHGKPADKLTRLENIPRASVPIKSGATPVPKNSGISELWNAPSCGIDFPRLNTKKRHSDRLKRMRDEMKTHGMRMQFVSSKLFRERIGEVLGI